MQFWTLPGTPVFSFQRGFYSSEHSMPPPPPYLNMIDSFTKALVQMLCAPSLGKQIKWNHIWSVNMGKRCGIHGIATRLFEKLHPKQDSHMLPVSTPVSRPEWSLEISPIQYVRWLRRLIHVPTEMKAPYWEMCYVHTPPWPHLTDSVIQGCSSSLVVFSREPKWNTPTGHLNLRNF